MYFFFLNMVYYKYVFGGTQTKPGSWLSMVPFTKKVCLLGCFWVYFKHQHQVYFHLICYCNSYG